MTEELGAKLHRGSVSGLRLVERAPSPECVPPAGPTVDVLEPLTIQLQTRPPVSYSENLPLSPACVPTNDASIKAVLLFTLR